MKLSRFLDYTLVAGSIRECVDDLAESIGATREPRWFFLPEPPFPCHCIGAPGTLQKKKRKKKQSGNTLQYITNG